MYNNTTESRDRIFSNIPLSFPINIIFRIKNKVYNRGRKFLTMQVTDIKIRNFFDEGPMKAIVSVTFDDCFAVHDIKVINARDKYFIVMPSRKNPDNTYRDIVHPINADFRSTVEEQIIEAYLAELEAIKNAPATEDSAS